MGRFASLSDPSRVVRGKLRAALFRSRQRRLQVADSKVAAQRLENGDFANGTAGWTGFGANGKSVADGKATFAATPAGSDISRPLTLRGRKYYDVTFTITCTDGSVTPRFLGGVTRNGTERSAAGTFTERLLANEGNGSFSLLPGPTGFTGTADDVTVVGPYDTPA